MTTTIHFNKVSVIITAAGSSTRMGGGVKKEYLSYKNGTVLSCCAKTFLNALSPKYSIISFVVTCPSGGMEDSKKAVFCDKELVQLLTLYGIEVSFVEGSSTRQASVFNAMKYIASNHKDDHVVLIHDGARPFVSSKIILSAVEAAFEYGASVPGIIPTDTQKEVDEDGFITRHLVRKNLRAVQTPQCFDFKGLFDGHEKALEDGIEYTDDTEIWGNYCGSVKVVEGDVNNIKITYPSDLELL